MAWLPESFVHPLRVAVGGGHRLRPILASDIDLDYPAVMGAPLDEAETALVGCVYIDPSEADTTAPFDAVVSWWMVDEAVGTPVEAALDDLVPRWLDESRPFSKVLHSP